MNLGIVPIQSLMGMANVAEVYGPKVAGYTTLIEAQAVTPVPFLVSGAFGIPAAAAGEIGEKDLRAAFAQLVHGRNKPTLLMARSSHREEKSGENESPMFPYFPPLWGTRWLHRSLHTGGYERGFQTFREIVEKMRQDPDMGILAMANVAGAVHNIGAKKMLGGELVSFVASTHSPVKPSQMDINVVQGLGTRAVSGGSDAIVIRADRKSGEVGFFEDITTEAREKDFGSRQEPTPDFYRQKRIDFYDLEFRDIVSLGWSELLRDGARIYFDMVEEPRFDILSMYEPLGKILLKPFGNKGQLTQLIGILQYFADRYGPCQIEGAFPTRQSNIPYLYQYLALPEMPKEARPLKPFKPHLRSSEVMGIGTFEGPLVYSHTVEWSDEIQALDRRFATTGYILLALRNTRELMWNTRHCRCRLSEEMEGASSHPVTLMADQIAKDPKAGFVFAMETEVDPMWKKKRRFGGVPPTEETDDYSLFPKARLDSNGEEVVVEVLP